MNPAASPLPPHQPPPNHPTGEDIERPHWRAGLWLRRHRPKGRRYFVWQWGVLRFGVPLAALATLLRLLTEPFSWRHFLEHLALNVAVAGVGGGYVAGRILWTLFIARAPRRVK